MSMARGAVGRKLLMLCGPCSRSKYANIVRILSVNMNNQDSITVLVIFLLIFLFAVTFCDNPKTHTDLHDRLIEWGCKQLEKPSMEGGETAQ